MPQGCLETGAKPYLTLLNFFFQLSFLFATPGCMSWLVIHLVGSEVSGEIFTPRWC